MAKANDKMGENIKDPLRGQLLEVLNRMGFGDGTPNKQAGNHAGIIVNYTSNAAPNTQDSVPHSLGRVPDHVFPTLPPSNQGASLHYIGADKQNVFLSCNVGSTFFKLYVE